MAGLEVGSVYTRLGYRVDDSGADRYERRTQSLRRESRREISTTGELRVDRRGFETFERRVDTARRDARRGVRAEGEMRVDRRGFGLFDRLLGRTRREARRDVKTEAGLRVDRRGFRQYDQAVDRADRRSRRLGVGARLGAGSVALLGRGAGLAAGFIGAAGLGGALAFAAEETSNAQVENAKLVGVLRSMGKEAPVTRQRVDELTDAIARQVGEDDELVKSSLTVLATFKNVRDQGQRNDSLFARSARTLKGLSLIFGLDMNRAAVQLGKALNDPIKGITALNRQGITFTARQRDMVKAWVEQGKLGRAQNYILREIEKQTGRVGREYGRSLPAALGRARTALGDLAERYGARLAPSVDRGLRATTRFVRQMESGRGAGGRFRRQLERIADGFMDIARPVARAVGAIARFVGKHPDLLKVAGVLAGVSVSLRAINRIRRFPGIDILDSGLRRLARTKAGQAMKDKIVEGVQGLTGALRRRLRPAQSAVRRAMESAGTTAGERGGSNIVHSTGATVEGQSRGRGRLARAFGRAGGLLGVAMGVALVAELGRRLNDWIAKQDPGRVTEGERRSGTRDLGLGVPGWNPFAKKQAGGIIPGRGRGDTVPTMLEPGEFVVRRAAVDRIGQEQLEALNRGELPGMQQGGRVRGLADTLRDERRKARDPLKGIGGDLTELGETGQLVGERTAKAIGGGLETARKEGRKESRRARREIGRDFEDLRRDAERASGRLARGVGGDLDDLRRRGGRAARRTRGAVEDELGGMARAGERHSRRLARRAGDALGDMARTGRRQGGRLRGSVESTMGAVDRAVHQGLTYVATATSEALKAFDAKPVRLNVPRPKGVRRAGGGWVGAVGEAGHDAVPALLGRGEAVLTRHQQQLVNDALGFTYGMELDDLFERVRKPHYMAQGGLAGVPRYQRGGGVSIVPIPWAPGERTNKRLLPLLTKLVKRFGFGVSDSFGPGHRSPGHTIFGTAVDAVAGRTGWDGVDRLVKWAVGRGLKVLYDGRLGSMAYPDHGRGNHAHIEFSDSSDYSRLKRGLGVDGLEEVPRIVVRGTQGPMLALAQAAINEGRGAANRLIEERTADAGGLGPGVGPGGGAASRAQMVRWARTALREAGVPATKENVEKILALSYKESRWIVDSINNWDSNARAGNPSGGLMHVTIDKVGGSRKNLFDPVKNMVASIRYQLRRYGGLITHSPYARGGIARFQRGGGWRRTSGRGRRRRTEITPPPSHRQRTKAWSGVVDRMRGDIETLGKRYDLAQRRADLTEEEFVVEGDETTPPRLNAEAITRRVRELDELVEIRRRIVAKYDRMLRYIRRLIAQYRRAIGHLGGIIGRARRALRSLRGRRGAEAERSRKRHRQDIEQATPHLRAARGRLAGWQDALTEEGLEREGAAIDLQELVNERAPLRGGGRGIALPEWTAPEAAGADATTAEPAATPEQVAQAAAEQLRAFTEGRAALFREFGRNFAPAGQNPFATELGQAAGMRYFGAGSFGQGGRVEKHWHQTVHFAEPPPDPHIWLQRLRYDAELAFG